MAPASSLKLTDPQQNQHTSLLKEQNQQGHLLIVLWIWLLTFHQWTDMILSWVVDQGLLKILIPCNKTLTSEETAQLLLENLYTWFGLPDKIILDRGPQFASKAYIELLKLLGIKSALSMAYHPQTDGTTEWVNQEIEAYLSIFCASHPEDWPQALHTLEFTHNNWRHADRQNTPFELMFGESLVAILLSFESTKYLTIEDKMKPSYETDKRH